LDVGVWNIHCAKVENAAHAAEIATASRYAPRGLRGKGGLSAATDFETAAASRSVNASIPSIAAISSRCAKVRVRGG
jgi:2-keto-3-deoxy-L-rhamnonate aldolase RhmA